MPKTAGNSIQNYLVNYSEDKIKIKGQYRQYNEGSNILNRFEVRSGTGMKIHKHMSLDSYYTKWRKEFDCIEDFFKFGVVRNPWDRAISYYFYGKNQSFDKNKFINKLNTEILNRSCASYFHVKKYNECKLDYVMRFENLQQDFDIVCDKIGIPKQQLPHANKTEHKHYTEYYDEETKQFVAKKYARDIELFGYKFGE